MRNLGHTNLWFLMCEKCCDSRSLLSASTSTNVSGNGNGNGNGNGGGGGRQLEPVHG
jgi:hypothetical protein